ncbi:head-tail adaptor protein [Vibrio vulnificus]|nr:head-tail adaptor protein [Vibrio vulnificus]
MRIGLIRHPIEIWDTVHGVDEYGVPTSGKKLILRCPAALKEVSTDLVGGLTKSVNSTVQITIRFSRSLKQITSSMYVVIDKTPYDIITPPNNHWRLNKYITFTATARSK